MKVNQINHPFLRVSFDPKKDPWIYLMWILLILLSILTHLHVLRIYHICCMHKPSKFLAFSCIRSPFFEELISRCMLLGVIQTAKNHLWGVILWRQIITRWYGSKPNSTLVKTIGEVPGFIRCKPSQNRSCFRRGLKTSPVDRELLMVKMGIYSEFSH